MSEHIYIYIYFFIYIYIYIWYVYIGWCLINPLLVIEWIPMMPHYQGLGQGEKSYRLGLSGWVSVAAKKWEVSLQVSGKEVTPSCEESHQWHDFVGGLRFCMSFIHVCPSLFCFNVSCHAVRAMMHWCILFSSRVVLQFCFMDVENLPKQNQHGIPLFLQTKRGIIAKSNPEAQNHLVWVSFWAPINPLN